MIDPNRGRGSSQCILNFRFNLTACPDWAGKWIVGGSGAVSPVSLSFWDRCVARGERARATSCCCQSTAGRLATAAWTSEHSSTPDRFNSPGGATHPPPSAMVAVVAMVAAMMAVAGVVEGQAKIHIQRRCYVCRSRGELGDCRDQFIPPEPLPPGTPVQVQPISFVNLGLWLVWD